MMGLSEYRIIRGSSIDTNSASVTDSIKIDDYTDATMHVVAASGSHSNHIIKLQYSSDDITFIDTSDTVTGTGSIDKKPQTGTYLRAKCTTVEGSSSVCDIYIILTKT